LGRTNETVKHLGKSTDYGEALLDLEAALQMGQVPDVRVSTRYRRGAQPLRYVRPHNAWLLPLVIGCMRTMLRYAFMMFGRLLRH
jgi:hypothetical protein